MSKLSSLIRASMSEGMQMMPYRFHGERAKRFLPFILAALVSLSVFGSAYVMMEDLRESGTVWTVLAVFVLATTVLTVMEGVYKTGDLLFRCHDNDMLLAMPIRRSTIVAMRILKFYLFEMLYCSIFLVPAIIAYALNAPVDASYILVAVMMILFLPAIPIAVSCVIGAISSGITARFQQRSFLQVLVSLGSLLVIVAMVLAINAASGFNGTTMEAIGGRTVEMYYPARVFVRLVTEFNLWELIQFILISVVVIAVTVFVIGKFYFQIVTRINVVARKKGVDISKLEFKRRSQTGAMIRKELIKYFNTPVLLANTAIGLVIFVVGVVVVSLKFDDIVGSIAANEEYPLSMEQLKAYVPCVTFALVAFTSLLTFITTTMLSLEGKAFNLLKTLPISGKKVLMTKVAAAMILIVPITAIGSLVMWARFGFGFIDFLLVLVAVVAVPFVTEMIGIMTDLKYARFNYDSDAEVVKQSPGVMISSFLGLGLTMVTLSLLLGCVILLGQTVGLLIVDIVFVWVAAILYATLSTSGEKKYMKLSA